MIFYYILTIKNRHKIYHILTIKNRQKIYHFLPLKIVTKYIVLLVKNHS